MSLLQLNLETAAPHEYLTDMQAPRILNRTDAYFHPFPPGSTGLFSIFVCHKRGSNPPD